MMKIGIAGSGTMGSGIAQLFATFGHDVILYGSSILSLEKSKAQLLLTLRKLSDKGKISREEADNMYARIFFTDDITSLAPCDWVIEAIVENFEIKKTVFTEIENQVSATCILSTNTSSLSVTAIAAICRHPERVLGVHFFNPAPLMPLVEIIPALQTDPMYVAHCKKEIAALGKFPVIAKDTPGFIVNRIARPFYGEALRIYEEGIADVATIDAAMRDEGFRLGPFELMDLIGNDINYAVTEIVFSSFYFDPRYRPSLTQKKMVEANWLGKKTDKGYYDYSPNRQPPRADGDSTLRKKISDRILCLLINEAYDALYLKIADREDIETAMIKGVNYPKGLLQWGEEKGLSTVRSQIEQLRTYYQDERYRCSPALR